MNPSSPTPDVSVVVPVRDAAADLSGLLAALDAQTLAPERFEVVIGDDGSRDPAAVAALARADGRVRVVPGPPRSSYAARNRAARAARGSVLAFTDADCRPQPDWLERGLAALDGRDRLVAGVIRHMAPARRTVWTLVDMDAFLDQERAVRGGVAVTANLLLPRARFERARGFDESVPEHGDHDLVARCVAAGAELRFAPDAAVHHPTRDRARALLRKFWVMNRWYGARARRRGQRPDALLLRAWVPVLRTARTRRWFGRSLLLDGHRLGAEGVRPRLSEHALALPVIYLLLPYIAVTAQLWGWTREPA